jgi:hypothetical protein
VLGIQLLEPEEDDEDEKGADFLVDPDNWDAVMAFRRCGTLWNYGVMGGVIGLKYEAVESVLNLTQPKKRHNEIFTAIQIMELAALEIMNSKSK